ncbi:DNA polymerase III subunit alpha [Oscillatoria salina]|uniref:DNA polymerase III subunit alpha n=1 Tax=Oscillatoria salina TaxID=331517 RepID=UPI0013BC3DE8|nr:DNA polymerase III subunit alpha [Oscillatoria salina]MBZ8181652.1 DNA polymerase III subunit alpha [Oscillatoria salina IIICB1]NET88665.1 DNA polymerase III subunit alpha [Kamptonema sp. SIO1D9]
MSFVGLHIHSDYSLLDGASQLPALVERAVELGMPAIALTDHGVMYGAVQLVNLCRDRGIKPIIGNEMYIINADNISERKKYQKFHQIVLAKNSQGYKNLVKLTTKSHLEGYYYRPQINKKLLSEYSEGLIITSACLAGEVPQNIIKGDFQQARQVAKWYKKIFGDDYYLELQDHGSREDRLVNVELVKIARELDIKLIITNDSHFIACHDVEAHDALLCIQTGKLIEDNQRMRYSGTEYLKSAEEMKQLFRDHLDDEIVAEAIANTLEIAEKVQPYNLKSKPRLPNFPIPSGYTSDTYLEAVAWEGLENRLKCKTRSEIEPDYKQRLEYELKIMQQMGFSTYFLVVWDYIKYARERQIPVGPGRGSAAGSLVAYALGITNIDPVHHGLLFERFLNPERISMPDIDTDFCIERRDEVINYVTEKYGADKVAQIITFNRMTSKAVLKDVARVLGVSYADSDRLAKMIPVARGKPAKLKVMISEATPEPRFKEAYEQETVKIKNIRGEEKEEIPVRRWVDMAIRIEGTNKTFGVHAAGVVISSVPLDEIVPLQRNNEKAVITQYSMDELESLGLLKMDFLGLKNLTAIQKTVKLIGQNKQVEIEPDEITFEERKTLDIVRKEKIKLNSENPVRKTYELLESGELEGVFQLESSGMRQVVQKLKPSNIEDISSILALYRPGPLDSGLVDQFIDRKHGREQVEYQHPMLEPILEETYGTLCFQEQIMRMAQDLAGYSLGQADLLRRAMGKKKMAEMQKHREIFIDGATKNGVLKTIAESLFEQMINFAEYCFNKSHSTAYAYVTYQTAYLKANYPVEFMATLLTLNSSNSDKIEKYIENCRTINIKIEPPDINRSEVDFTPVGEKILFGLSAVRNLGEAAIENILTARKEAGGKFSSLAELCDRVNLRVVNRRALETLIKCGALDNIEPNRNQLLHDLELVYGWAQRRAKDREIGQITLFDVMANTSVEEDSERVYESAPKAGKVADFPAKEKLQSEKELLGFYVSEHPLNAANKAAGRIFSPIDFNQLGGKGLRSKVCVIGMLSEVKHHISKKSGDRMAFVKVEDISSQIEGVVFASVYAEIEQYLQVDVPLVIWGKVDKREEKIQLIVEDLELIEKVRMIMIDLDVNQVNHSENDSYLNRLKSLLQEQRGGEKARVPVVGIIGSHQARQFVLFAEKYWVQSCQATVNSLQNAKFAARRESLLSDYRS